MRLKIGIGVIFVLLLSLIHISAELAAHPNGEYRQATRQTVPGQVQEIILGEHFDIFPKKIGGNSTCLLYTSGLGRYF